MRKFLTSFFEKLVKKVREKDPPKDSPIVILKADNIDNKNRSEAKKTPKKKKQKEKKDTSTPTLIKEALPSISPQKMKFMSLAGDIRSNLDRTEYAFMARQLVQATLPHKNPGNVPVWSRTNGGLTVSIQPGIDIKKKDVTGYPYGTIPRILLFWLITEAVRTNSPCIKLGNNLFEFMEALGLNPRMGGKRSDVKRLQDQMQRLFHSRISFSQTSKEEVWLNMQVTSKGMLWWNTQQPSHSTLWENWIQIGDDFFKAITSAPVPVDIRALKALKKSPLALDLYAWASYTAYQTQKTGQFRSVSWTALHKQFGAEYSDIKEFARNAWRCLLKVQAVYPELNIERMRGGIKVLPSKPSIIIKPKKTKKLSV